VVAEGVEHSRQLEWLRETACDEIQGFYYSPPLAVSEMESWMNERS
jgi:EAL domain-containing protein (putative c-di-GMP-specific phosphodiesterase class I)